MTLISAVPLSQLFIERPLTVHCHVIEVKLAILGVR